MAEKRMLSKVISISEKVNLLPDIFDMLLFTWMIPHTDDFGRMAGSPAKIKALVVPMLDKGIADVARSLDVLADAGLILLYEAEGDRVIQIVNFEKHQSGLHKRTKPKFPAPPTEIPGNSGNRQEIPLEEKGREEKGTEEKGREGEGKRTPASPDSPPSDDERDKLNQLITQCDLQNMNLHALERIYAFIGIVETGVIEASVKKSSGKHVNYAIKTLEGWAAEGKTRTVDVMPAPNVGERQRKTGGAGRSDKPTLPIISNNAAEAPTDEEFEARIRAAEARRADKQTSARGKDDAPM
ncbi:DNA replication protein DnaD [Saccharibacillus sacchari]|uniref:DNA replication protein DnaD n=1 Tax=Saccharibacillus sacchari TaxID=456493 RepID=A0ACC6PIB3_9BACL